MPRLLALALVIAAALSPLSGFAQSTDEGNTVAFGSKDQSKAVMVTRVELGTSTAETAVREEVYFKEALAQFEELGPLGDELKGRDVPAIKGASPIRAWGITIKDKPGEVWLFAADGWFYVSLVYQYDEKQAIAWIEDAIADGGRTLPTTPPEGLEAPA